MRKPILGFLFSALLFSGCGKDCGDCDDRNCPQDQSISDSRQLPTGVIVGASL